MRDDSTRKENTLTTPSAIPDDRTTPQGPPFRQGNESAPGTFNLALPLIPPPAAQDLLGEGGMGVVHTAHDPTLERTVAIKRATSALTPDVEASFVAEARLTGQLQHPNIASVYCLAADAQGRPYFTMQHIEGVSLRHWLEAPEHAPGTRARLEGALEVLLHVCDALAFAHSRGFLHRDTKPDNIMVAPHGRVYLMDWGVAIRKDRGENGLHDVAGSFRYMAPEALHSAPIDEGVDIFGLGAVLYEVLTGTTPYGSGDEAPVRIATRRVIPIGEALQGRFVSPALCAIADKAVAPNRTDRYRTVEELRDELRTVLRGGQYLPWRNAAPGEVIVQQGDSGDSAYLILDGRCRVTQHTPNGEVELRQVGTGEIFGELAVLLGGARTATVTAVSKTTLLEIDRSTLHHQGVLNGWSSLLLEALAKRFRDLEVELRNDA